MQPRSRGTGRLHAPTEHTPRPREGSTVSTGWTARWCPAGPAPIPNPIPTEPPANAYTSSTQFRKFLANLMGETGPAVGARDAAAYHLSTKKANPPTEGELLLQLVDTRAYIGEEKYHEHHQGSTISIAHRFIADPAGQNYRPHQLLFKTTRRLDRWLRRITPAHERDLEQRCHQSPRPRASVSAVRGGMSCWRGARTATMTTPPEGGARAGRPSQHAASCRHRRWHVMTRDSWLMVLEVFSPEGEDCCPEGQQLKGTAEGFHQQPAQQGPQGASHRSPERSTQENGESSGTSFQVDRGG